MSKKGIFQNVAIITIGLAIIIMSFSYAAIEPTKTTIRGNKTFEYAKWNVHILNPLKTSNTTLLDEYIIKSPEVGASGLNLSFSIDMQPNNIYELSFDTINSGTLNALLSDYTLVFYQNGFPVMISDSKTASVDNYLTYEILDTDNGEVLESGKTSTKTIRFTSKDESFLNNNETKYDFKLNMTYIQNN